MPEGLSKAFHHKGLECRWYLTHIENLKSILEQGILSYKRVRRSRVPYRSIANPSVRARRQTRANGVDLHDYVPLYMVWRNPMLWVVKKQPLAYIQVSLDAADLEGVIFSDGNAATGSTQLYEHPRDVDRLPWDVILGNRWTGSRIVDGKRKRCAEVLVPDMVETRFFQDIQCNLPTEGINVPSQFKHFLKCDPEFRQFCENR